MKLREITVRKGKSKKLTIKGKTGSYKSVEDTGEVVMNFELEDGEHLRDEKEVAEEVNDKVTEALDDLMNTEDPNWIKRDKGYKVAK